MKTYFDWLGQHDNVVKVLFIVVIAALLYTAGSLLVGYLVKKAVRSARGRTWHRKDVEKRQKTLVGLFVNMWRIIVIIIALYAILHTFLDTLSLAPLFASAGIIGVAIGFGSQSLVKDFLAGIFIISENQYRVGDIIDIDGNGGTVEQIGLRSTVLRDADGNVHYFPNGTVQHIINKTMGYSMARFTIIIQPTNDVEAVIALINQIGADLAAEDTWQAKIVTAPAFVSVTDFTATSVSLLISSKTQPSDQWSVTGEMRHRLLTSFAKNGIKLGTVIVPPTAAKK